MPHKPPMGRQEAAAANSQRIDQVFGALRDREATAGAGMPAQEPHEQQEDELLQELEKAISRASEILAQLRQGQAGVEHGPEDQQEPPGGPLG